MLKILIKEFKLSEFLQTFNNPLIPFTKKIKKTFAATSILLII